jgi:dihydrolipoamide dehydrogenase
MKYDVIVVGSGPGGYSAAFRASDLGLKVGLVERGESLGGVCLNVGCIPSKALLHAAKVIDDTRDMAAHGVDFGEPKIDLARLRKWKNNVVGQLTKGLSSLASQRKVDVIKGTGTFLSEVVLQVDDEGSESEIEFSHAIIATGSEPVLLPGVPYEDPRVMDSTGALSLAEIPENLLVIGGGIIGLEMASVYLALGSQVSVVELTDELMYGADRDLVKPLERRLGKSLEAVYTGTSVTRIEPNEDGLLVHFDGGKAPATSIFDNVLVSVGRKPNGDQIGAEKAGVKVGTNGFIEVDSQHRTNVPNIFAIGDIVGQPMLAHKAVHEGKIAAEVIAGHKVAFDARVIPSVAYTDPEVAWVGMTEREAKERGLAIGKGVFPWAASGRSLSLGRNEGLTKLIFEEKTDRIIGAGIVGPAAGDLIAEVALAIEMGCDAEDLALTIHPHPTLSETVAMGAEAFSGTITDLYMPKKN